MFKAGASTGSKDIAIRPYTLRFSPIDLINPHSPISGLNYAKFNN
jgi:hypothetical protein